MHILVAMKQPAIALGVALALLVPSAAAAPLRFAGVHYLELAPGDKKKPIQRAGSIIFDGDSVRVVARHGALTISKLRYDDIKSATYSRSKHPRWKAGTGVAVAAGAGLAPPVGVIALPLFFMKAKHHWLTLQAEGEFLSLRLSKKNYELVLTAAQAATGVEVERLDR